jgi:hypothetical protein
MTLMERALQVLRQHCEAEGRNYDEIEKTVLIPFDVGPDGSAAEQLVRRLAGYAEVGVQTVIGGFAVDPLKPVEIMGRDVLPQVALL